MNSRKRVIAAMELQNGCCQCNYYCSCSDIGMDVPEGLCKRNDDGSCKRIEEVLNEQY